MTKKWTTDWLLAAATSWSVVGGMAPTAMAQEEFAALVKRMEAEKPKFAQRHQKLLAERYDRLRPADANWLEVADAIWAEGDMRGRRVLDVGCGTGRLTAEIARRLPIGRVVGIDSSPAMLSTAAAFKTDVHRYAHGDSAARTLSAER